MPRKLQPGTPSRSLRYVTPTSGRRLVTFSIGGAVLALIIGVALFATGVRTVASPGDVAGAHSTIDGRCAQCHEPAKAVTDVRCERCHDPLGARRFAAPAHAAIGGSGWRAAHAESLACGSCHAEHRGRDAVLSRVADQNCTSCHGFGSFRRHPEIAAVRAGHEVEPGLDFSHEIHLREVAKVGADRCQACHQSTDNQAGFEPIAFDTHCVRCHIKDGVLTLNGKDVLKSGWTPAALLPAADASQRSPARTEADERGRVTLEGFVHRDPWVIAAANGITRITSAPGLVAERARLADQMARSSAFAQVVPVSAMADADLERLRASLTSEIEAIDRQMAGGPSAPATALDLSAGRPGDPQQVEERRAELDQLLAAIAARTSGSVADRAQALRGDLANLKADASPASAPDGPALTDRLDALDAALRAVESAGGPAVASDIQALRAGVHAQLSGAGDGVARDAARAQKSRLLERVVLEQTLRRDEEAVPVDAVARPDRATAVRQLDALRARVAAIDAQISSSPQIERSRASTALKGLLDACVKCHRFNNDDTALRPVTAARSMLLAATFTHKPHLLQARGCETCHASVTTSKAGLDTSVPSIASCQSCHSASQARADCVSCHVFHPRSAAEVALSAWR